MPQSHPPSAAPAERYWSTMPGRTPGVRRKHRRWICQIPFGGTWLYLASCPFEIDAVRLARAARALPLSDRARLARCATPTARRRLLAYLLRRTAPPRPSHAR